MSSINNGNILDVCSTVSVGAGPSAIPADFIGKANLWVENDYTDQAIDLVRYLMFQAISKTAPGQLSVIGYDSELSGLFAPFAGLASENSDLLELISDQSELVKKLKFLKDEIVGVQNVVQGRYRSLYDFRKSTGRPLEGYKLIVLALDMGLLDNNVRNMIALLMRAGPLNGVSFLILSTTMITVSANNGNEIVLTVDRIAPNTTVFENIGSDVRETKSQKKTGFRPIPARDIIALCTKMIDDAQNAQLPVVRFDELELHNPQGMWTGNSTDGLTFAVGKYGMNDMEITIGDEFNQRHNVLITGAVGQGKSNLISMIIHSLCMRYSPKEVQLYLLDFKEGVTFKAFSNIGQSEYLPHARTLGLESDVSFGISVLQALFKEFKRRTKLFKDSNCKSLQEYRHTHPNESMPRIVTMIDEFQMMFGDEGDPIGKSVAELLEKSVRLFRATGIHFILASQSLKGNVFFDMKKESIFSQFPIRIGLKNSINESMATFTVNNVAAAYLRPREAIVNPDYGAVSQNRKTIIGFADEKLLKPFRTVWWERSRREFPPPYVFESERRITISSAISEIWKFRETAKVPRAFVSQNISISGDNVSIPMSSEPGRNIAILGSPDEESNSAAGILQSIAVSLALQHTDGRASFRFYDFANPGRLYEDIWPDFAAALENCGYCVETGNTDTFKEDMDALAARDNGDPVYIFASSLDRWEQKQQKGPGGMPMMGAMGAPLQAVTMEGPAKGIHFFGWWVKADNFKKHVSGMSSGSNAFNTRVFLRIDERTVSSYSSPGQKWSPQNNRALIADDVEFVDPVTVIPFAPLKKEDVSLFR